MFDERADLPSMRLVKPSGSVRRFAKMLASAFVLAAISLAFLPWVQNVRGTGRVVALDPVERPQPLKAAVSGRIVKWHVREGAQVKQGDLIVEIQDLDPLRLENLRFQQTLLQEKLQAEDAKLNAMMRVVESAVAARDARIDAANQAVEVSEQALVGSREGLRAAVANELQMRRQLARTKELVEQKILSIQDQDIAEANYVSKEAQLKQAEASVRSSEAAVKSSDALLQAVTVEETGKVDKTRAEVELARGTVATVSKDSNELKSRISAQETQAVRAPRDGVIQHIFAREGQDIVSQGEELALLVPTTNSRIAEVMVDGMHAPLIDIGDPVRLQFEGWPAVQFSGWPSVAVGTFGGQVLIVDGFADDQGRFRVLVEPDPNVDPWPEPAYLRQGARAKGWLLLDEVSLGWEVWRQLNGFPPARYEKKPPKVTTPK